MTPKHPILHDLTSILTNMAVFGFAVFYMLDPRLLRLNWQLLAAGLFLIQLLDFLVLKHPISIGRYIACNLIPSLIFLFFGRQIPVFSDGSLVSYIWFYAAFCILLAYRICRACRPAPQSASILTVDGLIVLFILIKLWQHINPAARLTPLTKITAAALLAEIFYLAVCRLPLPSLRATQNRQAFSGQTLLVPGFLLLLGIIGGTALLIGEQTSSLIMSGITMIAHLLLAAWRLLCSILAAAWNWLNRLLPDAPPGEWKAYEMSPSVEAILERGQETVNAMPLLILLAVCAAAAVFYALFKFSGHVLKLRTLGTSTAKNERRSFHLAGYFRALFRQIRRWLSTLWLLLTRPNSIPALVLRAHWYGRRHLHPRKKGETIREYLTRLDALHTIGSAAGLLSAYADQYFYGAGKPEPAKEDILCIKKAFPIF